MRGSLVALVATREYLDRVRRKGFWISTFVVPMFMIGSVLIPVMVAKHGAVSRLHVAVVDESGLLPDDLPQRIRARQKATIERRKLLEDDVREQGAELVVELSADTGPAARAALDGRILAGTLDGWILVPAEAAEKPARPELHSRKVGSVPAMRQLELALSDELGAARLRRAGIDEGALALTASADVRHVPVGGRGAGSLGATIVVAFSLVLTVYSMLIFYGNFVMRGILEEKMNRVVEVVLSAIRPSELLFGKVLGIGAAGLTQIGIWCLVAANLTVLRGGHAPSGFPAIPATLMAAFVLCFGLGYFLYSMLFAAVGAAYDNEQDAQQMAGIVIALIVVPVLLANVVMANPSGTASTVLSLVPFFTPMLMLLRIALEPPPVWQLLLSVVLTLGTTVLLAILGGRIYRTGLLLYGKRPTFGEIVKWMRAG